MRRRALGPVALALALIVGLPAVAAAPRPAAPGSTDAGHDHTTHAGHAGQPAAVAATDRSPAKCGPGDRPESGLQGQVPIADQLSGRSRQGYTCNIRGVAVNDINGRGGDTQMTWAGRCAYRVIPARDGKPEGVAVLDVRDPRRPRLARILAEPAWASRGGVLKIHEGISANERRGILVVPVGTMLSIYDIRRDCSAPRLVSSFEFDLPDDTVKRLPGFDDGIHSGKISPDGTFYYATDIGNGAVSLSGPCLTVIDLANLTRPQLVTRWGAEFPCHDLSFNADGTRAYVGYYAGNVGHPSAVVGAFTPAVAAAHAVSGLKILDTSAVQRRAKNPSIEVVSELNGGRQHTETVTRIGNRTYVIAGEEGFCPGGNGRIVDITDERKPVQVAEIPLAVNSPENCAVARADRENELLLYMSHYISVDNPDNASLVFFTWYSSGLRVFDVRDPRNPREVAYYNPPVGEGAAASHDSSTTYPRYLPATGQIWFGSGVNGFNVVELAPRLRPKVPGVQVSERWSVGPFSAQLRASAGARTLVPARPDAS